MVGYYSEASLTGQVRTIGSAEDPFGVNKLVCSPDLIINDQETTNSCQVCNKMYTSKAAFASHLKTHTKETEDPYR